MESSKSLKKESLSGFKKLLAGSGVQAICNIVFLAILARHLTPFEFGVVGAVTILVILSDTLTRVGLGASLIQKESISQRDITTVFWVTSTVGVIFTILIAVFSSQIATFLAIKNYASVVFALAFCFFLRGISITAEAIAAKQFKFGIISFSQAFSYIAGYGTVAITLTFLGYGLYALVFGLLAQSLIKSLMLLFLVPHPKKFDISLDSIKELSPYGMQMSLLEMINYFSLQLDKFVIAKYIGTAQLGVYGRAASINSAPTTAINIIIDRVLFPIISSVKNDKVRVQRGFSTCINYLPLFVFPAMAALILCSSEIVLLLLGKGWSTVVPAMNVMTVSIFFRVFYKLCSTTLRGMGMVSIVTISQVCQMVILALACWWLKDFGLVGIAVALLVSIAFHAAFLLFSVSKVINVDFVSYFKLLILIALATILSWYLAQFIGVLFLGLNLFLLVPIKVSVFGLSYIILIFCLIKLKLLLLDLQLLNSILPLRFLR